MGQLELVIALVVFVGTMVAFGGTMVGAILYLRSDARANRQEWKAESEANRQEWKAESEANRQEWKADLSMVLGAINGLRDDVGRLDQRLTALEVKVDILAEKLGTKAEESTVQRNHRELLIRVAFHHHGDGRYPVVAATDPEPVNPTDGDV